MQFIKSDLPAPRDARILVHVGEGLEQYSVSGYVAERRKLELGQELKWWAWALPEEKAPDSCYANVIFPEINLSEKAAVRHVFNEIAKMLQKPNGMLSIATRSTAVAQLIVDMLVQLGLQRTVQVFCHENNKVTRGWVLDQNTALATDAFDLKPAVDEDYIRQLDFGSARAAAQS